MILCARKVEITWTEHETQITQREHVKGLFITITRFFESLPRNQNIVPSKEFLWINRRYLNKLKSVSLNMCCLQTSLSRSTAAWPSAAWISARKASSTPSSSSSSSSLSSSSSSSSLLSESLSSSPFTRQGIQNDVHYDTVPLVLIR